MTEKELLKVLGLDKKISLEVDIIKNMTYKPDKNSLENDLLKIMGKDGDQYLKQLKEEENKRKEFVKLFKECYDDIVKVIEKDVKKRIPVNCYTCVRGMDLSKQYGKPKPKN